MKPFYYHIGSEKCASTLIELFFSMEVVINDLHKCGVAVNTDFTVALRHLGLFDDWDAERHGRIRDKYLTPQLTSEQEKFFSTEESLLGLVHEKGKSNACRQRCSFIASLTEGFDTRLIILIRRQDGFLESMYNQSVKRSETRDFESYCASLPLENYEWDKIVATFKDAFGSQNVTVIPFEKTILETSSNDATNILEAIIHAMGVNFQVHYEGFPIMNPSLPARFLPVQRQANEVLSVDEAKEVANILARSFSKDPNEKLGLFDDSGRRAILERYRESNCRLFTDHMPAYDEAEYVGF